MSSLKSSLTTVSLDQITVLICGRPKPMTTSARLPEHSRSVRERGTIVVELERVSVEARLLESQLGLRRLAQTFRRFAPAWREVPADVLTRVQAAVTVELHGISMRLGTFIPSCTVTLREQLCFGDGDQISLPFGASASFLFSVLPVEYHCETPWATVQFQVGDVVLASTRAELSVISRTIVSYCRNSGPPGMEEDASCATGGSPQDKRFPYLNLSLRGIRGSMCSSAVVRAVSFSISSVDVSLSRSRAEEQRGNALFVLSAPVDTADLRCDEPSEVTPFGHARSGTPLLQGTLQMPAETTQGRPSPICVLTVGGGIALLDPALLEWISDAIQESGAAAKGEVFGSSARPTVNSSSGSSGSKLMRLTSQNLAARNVTRPAGASDFEAPTARAPVDWSFWNDVVLQVDVDPLIVCLPASHVETLTRTMDAASPRMLNYTRGLAVRNQFLCCGKQQHTYPPLPPSVVGFFPKLEVRPGYTAPYISPSQAIPLNTGIVSTGLPTTVRLTQTGACSIFPTPSGMSRQLLFQCAAIDIDAVLAEPNLGRGGAASEFSARIHVNVDATKVRLSRREAMLITNVYLLAQRLVNSGKNQVAVASHPVTSPRLNLLRPNRLAPSTNGSDRDEDDSVGGASSRSAPAASAELNSQLRQISVWLQWTMPRFEAKFDDVRDDEPHQSEARSQVSAVLEDISASFDLQRYPVLRSQLKLGKVTVIHEPASASPTEEGITLVRSYTNTAAHLSDLDAPPAPIPASAGDSGSCLKVQVVSSLSGAVDAVSITAQSFDVALWCPAIATVVYACCVDQFGAAEVESQPVLLIEPSHPPPWPSIDCKLGILQLLVPSALHGCGGAGPDMLTVKVSSIIISPSLPSGSKQSSPNFDSPEKASTALQHGDWETSSQSSWATDRAMDGFPSDRRLHVEVTGLTAWTSRQCEVSSVRASTTTPAFKVLQDNPALRWNVRAERQEQRGDINLLLLPLNLQLVASQVATTRASVTSKLRQRRGAVDRAYRIKLELSASRAVNFLICDKQFVLFGKLVANNFARMPSGIGAAFNHKPRKTVPQQQFEALITLSECSLSLYHDQQEVTGGPPGPSHRRAKSEGGVPRGSQFSLGSTVMPLLYAALDKPIVSFSSDASQASGTLELSNLILSTPSNPTWSTSQESLTSPGVFDEAILSVAQQRCSVAMGNVTLPALVVRHRTIDEATLELYAELNHPIRILLTTSFVTRLLRFVDMAELLLSSTPPPPKQASSQRRQGWLKALQIKAKSESITVDIVAATPLDEFRRGCSARGHVHLQSVNVPLCRLYLSPHCLGPEAEVKLSALSCSVFRDQTEYPILFPCDLKLVFGKIMARDQGASKKRRTPVYTPFTVDVDVISLDIAVGPNNVLGCLDLYERVLDAVLPLQQLLQSTTPQPSAPNLLVDQSAHDLGSPLFSYSHATSSAQRPGVSEVLFFPRATGASVERRQIARMSWRYLHSRVVSSIFAMPCPFETGGPGGGSEASLSMVCSLQYWDEIRLQYISMQTFKLYSNKSCTYPLLSDVSAKEWQVIARPGIDDDGTTAQLNSEALMACIHVSSCRSTTLSPHTEWGVNVRSLNVECLNCNRSMRPNRTDFTDSVGLPPDDGTFALITGSELDARGSGSNSNGITARLRGQIGVAVVDLYDLTLASAVEPTKIDFRLRLPPKLSDSPDKDAFDFVCGIGRVNITLKTSFLRLFASTYCSWERRFLHRKCPPATSKESGSITTAEGVPTTVEHLAKQQPNFSSYTLVNCVHCDLYIRQCETDEDITLQPGVLCGYSWRTHRGVGDHRVQLRAESSWTTPIDIDQAGIWPVEIQVKEAQVMLWLSIMHVEGGQRCIRIIGRHVFRNQLPLPVVLTFAKSKHFDDQSAKQSNTLPPLITLQPDCARSALLPVNNVGTVCQWACASDQTPQVPVDAASGAFTSIICAGLELAPAVSKIHTVKGTILVCCYNQPVSTSASDSPTEWIFSPVYTLQNQLPISIFCSFGSVVSGTATTGPEACEPGSKLEVEAKSFCPLLCEGPPVVRFGLASRGGGVGDGKKHIFWADQTVDVSKVQFNSEDNDGKQPATTKTAKVHLEVQVAGITVVISLSKEAPHPGTHIEINPIMLIRNMTQYPLYLKVEATVLQMMPASTVPFGTSRHAVATKDQSLSISLGARITKAGVTWSAPMTIKDAMMDDAADNLQGAGSEITISPTDRGPGLRFMLRATCSAVGSGPSVLSISHSILVQNHTQSPLRIQHVASKRELLIPCSHGAFEPQHPLPWLDPLSSSVWVRFCLDTAPPDSTEVDHDETKRDSRLGWSLPLNLASVDGRLPIALPRSGTDSLPLVLSVETWNSVKFVLVSHDPSPRMLVRNSSSSTLALVAPGAPVSAELLLPPKSGLHISDTVKGDVADLCDRTPHQLQLRLASHEKSVAVNTRRLGTQQVQIADRQTAWVRITMHKCTREVEVTGAPPEPLGAHRSGQGCAATPVHFQLDADAISCSFVAENQADKTEGEAFLLTMQQLHCDYNYVAASDPCTQDQTLSSATATVGSIQLDNQAPNNTIEYSVILCKDASFEGSQPLAPDATQSQLSVQVSWSPDDANSGALAVQQLRVQCQPLMLNAEDCAVEKIIRLAQQFSAAATAPLDTATWSSLALGCSTARRHVPASSRASAQILSDAGLPTSLIKSMLAAPLCIHNLIISPVHFTVSVRASVKVFVNVDNAVVELDGIEMAGVFAAPSAKLWAVLGERYAAGSIGKAGWALGSLGILGNPTGLARSVKAGVHDLVVLPIRGLADGPGAFVEGFGQGASSFFRHVSLGTLSSLSGFASSVSRNMEHLSMDKEHLEHQQAIRTASPEVESSAVATGLTGLGYSLLSAVAGIVDQPMQSLAHNEDPTALNVLGGVGRGVLGVFTKPVGGAMELVATTSQGILNRSGLVFVPQRQRETIKQPQGRNSRLKYSMKIVPRTSSRDTLLLAEAFRVSPSGQRYTCTLVLTRADLLIVVRDAVQQTVPLSSLITLGTDGVDESIFTVCYETGARGAELAAQQHIIRLQLPLDALLRRALFQVCR